MVITFTKDASLPKVFERFSEEARHVVVLAQEEARALKHSYIGTEHILLGLLREEEQRPEGERPLESLGVTLDDVRTRVTRIVGPGEEASGDQIPFTPRAKKVLELSLREALSLGPDRVAPEHLLLGIVRDNEGVASRVLLALDADALKVRNAVVRSLDSMPRRPRATAREAAGGHTVRLSIDPAWLDGLAGVLSKLSREIRGELGRDPDLGDLLLTLACARETSGAQALHELGVDLDALWGALERIRQRRAEEREQLIGQVGELQAKKQQAIEKQDFQEAARFRDQERGLSERLGAELGSEQDVLREVRRRLGLPGRDG
jgi:ATP-dependent Clp protease ATP-binding subunit ClpA